MASLFRALFAAPKRTAVADADADAKPRDRQNPSVHGQGHAGVEAVQYVGAVTSSGVAGATGLAGVYAIDAVPAPQTVAAALGLAQGQKPLRIVVISDTHEFHNNMTLPPGDVLVHCGDFLTLDSWNPGFLSNLNMRNFFGWMNRQPFALRIVVGGNHDHQAEKLGAEAMRAMAAPTVYADSELIEVAGLRIFATPRSTPGGSSNRAFQLPSVDAHDRWVSRLPDSVTVLSRAVPKTPRGTRGCDSDSDSDAKANTREEWARRVVPREWMGKGADAAVDIFISHGAPSCRWAREAVVALAPALHLCGHEHGMHGVWRVDPRTCRRVRDLDTVAAAMATEPVGTPRRGTISVNGASIRGGPMKEYVDPPIIVDYIPANPAATAAALIAAPTAASPKRE